MQTLRGEISQIIPISKCNYGLDKSIYHNQFSRNSLSKYMKKFIWIILILLLCCSCVSAKDESEIFEIFYVGKQEVGIRFTSLESIYENQSPTSTTLEVENKSELPIYLPWGLDPGYFLIFVSLDSNSRTIFGPQLPTSITDLSSYQIISPGELITSNINGAPYREAGKYNLCAEVLILSENGSDHIKPRICVPIKYID